MNQPARASTTADSAGRRQPADPGQVRLSPREVECLQWVALGKSSTDIGQLLGLSPRTVDDYVGGACAKFGVRGRIQAVIVATALGVLAAAPRR